MPVIRLQLISLQTKEVMVERQEAIKMIDEKLHEYIKADSENEKM